MRRADRGMMAGAMRLAFAYRVRFLTGAALLVAEIFLLRKIWTAVYDGQSSVDGLSLDALIVYLTLVNLQMVLMTVFVSNEMQFRIRTGRVFFDFVRPIGYPRQMFEFQLGMSGGQFILILPAIPVALLVGSISAPAGGWAGVGYVVSVTLGYVMSVCISLIIGMAAFWTLELGGVALLYRLVSRFFAGTMIPLTFFPGPLQTVADLLPFRYFGYVPAAIYVGVIEGTELAETLAVQAVWVLALAGLMWLVWRRAQHRLVVQGG
ncbi:MAG TPA: ABC-2 family transporter protein [Candidatus Limnocylindrales bacterium]